MEGTDLWSHKPWWCQPWSILLTGVAAIVACGWMFHSWWLTLILIMLVVGWWWTFLVVAPRSYREWIVSLPAGDEGSGPAPEQGEGKVSG